MADAFGTIDILINNAGVYHPLPMEETTEALWDAQIDINLKGSFFMAKAVAPVMKAKGAGKIVNITSTLGVVGSSTGAAYCASKGGQMLLTKALGLELGSHGINVNAVGPGATRTDMNAAIRAQPGKVERKWRPSRRPAATGWRPTTSRAPWPISSRAEADAVHGAHLMIDLGWTAW